MNKGNSVYESPPTCCTWLSYCSNCFSTTLGFRLHGWVLDLMHMWQRDLGMDLGQRGAAIVTTVVSGLWSRIFSLAESCMLFLWFPLASSQLD